MANICLFAGCFDLHHHPSDPRQVCLGFLDAIGEVAEREAAVLHFQARYDAALTVEVRDWMREDDPDLDAHLSRSISMAVMPCSAVPSSSPSPRRRPAARRRRASAPS